MRTKIELSRGRALKLIKAWKGHLKCDTSGSECKAHGKDCPINKFFMELEEKFGDER
jgi:hypothetical protein